MGKAAAATAPPRAAAPPQAAAAAPPQAATLPRQVAAPPASNGHAAATRVFISPLARRMAQQAGLDPALLKGSGPHGRIVKADVEGAAAGGGAKSAVQSIGAAAATRARRWPAGL
jgi:pyruvate dehydrogenase E2 component (dihydrolipoamide acetyltransferase)